MSQNKRRARRQCIRHPAWVTPTPDQRIDCFVTDVSEAGARIQVKDATTVPDCFILLLSTNGAPRRFCRVAWRKSDQLGVKFARTFAEAANMPARADDKAVPAPLEGDEAAGVA